MKTDKLVWFVAGASIGATLALLFAPQSGHDTRKYIGKRARKGREALEEAGEDLMEKGRDLYEKGREMAEEMADDASGLIDRGRRMFEG